MTRKKSDKGWMARHVRDPYVKQAVRQGYRSRAAFKLIELDERERLFRPGLAVLDLGAAPGGWSQVAAARVGRTGSVIAVDLGAMQALPGVTMIRGDLRDLRVHTQLQETLKGQRVDLVLSDMAPNLSGIAAADEAHAQELIETAVAICTAFLKPGGVLLVKAFHGSGLDEVIVQMRGCFASVVMRKPQASRSRSSEVYVLCRGLIVR
jgi:23S rRNA (uridine2552-2'-O)-methyltransferase